MNSWFLIRDVSNNSISHLLLRIPRSPGSVPLQRVLCNVKTSTSSLSPCWIIILRRICSSISFQVDCRFKTFKVFPVDVGFIKESCLLDYFHEHKALRWNTSVLGVSPPTSLPSKIRTKSALAQSVFI